jgi:hypothetical protein
VSGVGSSEGSDVRATTELSVGEIDLLMKDGVPEQELSVATLSREP